MNSNPYGLLALWQEGDWITRLVALCLLGMSILSWYVIIVKSAGLNRLKKQAEIAVKDFWQARNLDEGVRMLAPDAARSPFRNLAEDGINAMSHHTHNRESLHDTLNPSEWLNSCLRRSIENIAHNLQAGLPVLASIGSTAPFVGLLGTVWGIYHALIKIGLSGEASIDKVAGPVGEALIMTAFGLAVAIPAVLAYNALTQNNRKILSRVRNFAHDLHACLLTGARVGNPSKHFASQPNGKQLVAAVITGEPV